MDRTSTLRSNYVALVAKSVILIGSLVTLGCQQRPKQSFGFVRVTLAIQTVDEESSKPLKGASFVMIDPFGRQAPATRADELGLVSVTESFQTGGVETSERRSGRISFEGWLCEASAQGYQSYLVPLADAVSDSIDFRSPPSRSGTVRLRSVQTATAGARSASELYERWYRNPIRLLLHDDSFYEIMNELTEDVQSSRFAMACGTVVQEGAALKLTIKRAKSIDQDDPDWHLDGLWSVPWGDRHYLVSQTQWLIFCNAVNQGKEPRSGGLGEFFLRNGDERKPVGGLPTVPAPWNEYLLREPVLAKVVKVLASGDAVIDAGSAAGLRKGMELHPPKLYLFSDQVVDSVEENSAVVKTKHARAAHRRVQAGDTVVSRLPRTGGPDER